MQRDTKRTTSYRNIPAYLWVASGRQACLTDTDDVRYMFAHLVMAQEHARMLREAAKCIKQGGYVNYHMHAVDRSEAETYLDRKAGHRQPHYVVDCDLHWTTAEDENA